MTGTTVRVLLARHGETEWNVEGRWQGQQDSRLTPRGVEQARGLARALADEDLAAVYSSDLGRAFETARLVAEPHRLAPIADRRLREIDVGRWTTRLGAEIHHEFPEETRAWKERPWSVRLPDGETLAEVQARAISFFDETMPALLGQTVVVIAHGTIGQTIVVRAMGQPIEEMWLKDRIDNCQISRLEWSPASGLRLVELCDVRHLEDIGSLKGWRVTEAGEEDAENVA